MGSQSYQYQGAKFFISEDFKLFLGENRSNTHIANLEKLQYKYLTEDSYQVSFINYKNGMISFLPIADVYKEYLENKKIETFETYCTNNRVRLIQEGEKNTVKVGRFIKKMFPLLTDAEAELFVNICKNYKSEDDYEFVIFTGEDIKKYYNRVNQDIKQSGRMGSSCMNWLDGTETHCTNKFLLTDLLQFYVVNPKCSLLALRLKNEEKISGRALLWTTDDGRKYIEVVYTNNYSLDLLYKKYAEKNKYLCQANGDRGFTITCSEETKKLKVLPTYLDSLTFDKNKFIITR